MEKEVKNQQNRRCGFKNVYGVHALGIRKPEVNNNPHKWHEAVLPLHPHRRAGEIILAKRFCIIFQNLSPPFIQLAL
ncbi:MAG: hypothetical protein A2Y62_06125 [Candidatus Fischerbacteria bacterium RBG_13_37_8]|uniref:Uncharacterized protein n=1 Tax=Candidatus Fischerbacteria bacterium RBG_13_37_8 TaxID=1817863 RepID=A0A1F5VSG4_9BACT|nr:MAG: hypothetical protein A2Y62_06125 [Candidatus Fischerbacteria bacterium RBG_13_37_8]